MSKRRTKTPERKSNNPTKAGSKFSIESLVKDAQQNELRPNVTPDHHFLFLCLAQTLFVYCVSVGLDHYHQNHHFLNAALISFSVHWCGFAVSCFIGSCKYFDITEDTGLLYMFYSSYVASCSPAPTLRQQLVHGCAALWGVRLLAFVGGRVLVRGRDFRFDKCTLLLPRSPPVDSLSPFFKLSGPHTVDHCFVFLVVLFCCPGLLFFVCSNSSTRLQSVCLDHWWNLVLGQWFLPLGLDQQCPRQKRLGRVGLHWCVLFRGGPKHRNNGGFTKIQL